MTSLRVSGFCQNQKDLNLKNGFRFRNAGSTGQYFGYGMIWIWTETLRVRLHDSVGGNRAFWVIIKILVQSPNRRSWQCSSDNRKDKNVKITIKIIQGLHCVPNRMHVSTIFMCYLWYTNPNNSLTYYRVMNSSTLPTQPTFMTSISMTLISVTFRFSSNFSRSFALAACSVTGISYSSTARIKY